MVEILLRQRRQAVPIERRHEHQVGRAQRRLEDPAAGIAWRRIDSVAFVPNVDECGQRQFHQLEPALLGGRLQGSRGALREGFAIASVPAAGQQEQEAPRVI
jgi:hypothetical protein